jgi:hypothetical protein
VAQFDGVAVARHPELTVEHLVEQLRTLGAPDVNTHLLASLSGIVANTINCFKPDIIHFHNAHHFAPELALALFQTRQSAPMINSAHDRVGEHLYPGVLKYRRAHTIFASQYLLDALPAATGSRSVLNLGIEAWASGAMFLMLNSVLGIRPSAQRRELNIVNPELPDWLEYLRIRNLRVGQSRVGLDFFRRGTRTFCNVVEVEGEKLLVNVAFKK